MERNTRQRQAVLAVMEEQNRPLTSRELCEEGQKKIPRLGIATVYRILRNMEEEAQIIKLDYPGQPARYERPTYHHHPHFLCSSCNKVFDLPPQNLTRAPKLPPGFSATGSETIIYGSCPACGAS